MVTIRRKNPDGTVTTLGNNKTVAPASNTGGTIDYSQDAAKASQQGYNSANYQKNWGIGNYNNITGGFNNYNDLNSLRNEIGRVNTVTKNREGYGLDNTQYNNYLEKLNTAYKPITDAENKASNAQSQWETSQASRYDDYMSQFNAYNDQATQAQDSWRSSASAQGLADSQNATISSIAQKYGFDFSRDAARQQAEAEAQALRNANADAQRRNQSNNKLNTGRIDANIMNATEALDRNYFQQGLAQQQNQVNSGLNAGIAADQALRLQMGRQAEMADVYRDANLGLMEEQQRFSNEDLRLAEALGLIDQQAIAQGNAAWEEQQRFLYDVINQDRNHYLAATDMERAQSNTVADRLMQMQNALTNNYQYDTNLGYNQYRDTVADSQFDRNLFTQQAQNSLANQQWQQNFDQMLAEFAYGQQRDQVGDQQWQQQFDWGRLMDEAGLTGMYNGNRTMQGQQFDWTQVLDRAGLTGMFEGGKTWDRQMDEFDMNLAMQQLALQRASAGGGGGGGGSSSGGSSGASAQPVQNLANQYKQYQAEKYSVPSSTGLSQDLMNEYVGIKTQPVMQIKTPQQKVTEALVDGVIAPDTTTSWGKLNNFWNTTRN